MFSQTQPETVQERTLIVSGRQIFSTGQSDTIGVRSSMEDACSIIGEFTGANTQYYGVFDGHGGNEVSTYCANNLHRKINRILKEKEITVEKAITEAIEEINQEALSKFPDAGTTAGIVIIINNIVYCANVGDTRILLIEKADNSQSPGQRGRRGWKPTPPKVTRCSYDHKASDPQEKEKVLERGGHVIQGRVNGCLMLSRAIGDAAVGPGLSCEPYITRMKRKDGMKVVIACDGVFDVLDDETVGSVADRIQNPQEAARTIKDMALERGTTDNVTCVVINLTPK
ncbi:hypothetical protein M9Y10_001870 [Tritrichomonas musculus]|uniref:PPM-type phosphatase domain-containing protein n=1 Tax=Tritrichomonas musculus TaxID=1915356 RepID=A0ABR2L8B0_9EUKA